MQHGQIVRAEERGNLRGKGARRVCGKPTGAPVRLGGLSPKRGGKVGNERKQAGNIRNKKTKGRERKGGKKTRFRDDISLTERGGKRPKSRT